MSRVSLACVVPSWLRLLLMDSEYTSRGTTSPVMNAPDEKPPRNNSSDICRSDAAQNGHEPCIDRAVSVGRIPTPIARCLFTRYCTLPKISVCCVAPSDQLVML